MPDHFPFQAASLAVNQKSENFCDTMKLQIEIDDKLMREAMRSGRYRTRKAAIGAGMRLLVLRGQTKTRRPRGKIAWEGDLEQSRLGRNTDQ